MSKSERITPTIEKSHKVKSCFHYALPAEGGALKGRKYKQYEEHYDESGNKIETIEYSRGKIVGWFKYSYNSLGAVDEITRHNGSGYSKDRLTPVTFKAPPIVAQEPERGKPIIEFDKCGRKVESVFYKNGKLKYRTTYRKDGTCQEDILYKDELVSTHKKFNDKGLLFDHSTFTASGDLANHKTYEYDNRDNIVRFKQIAGDILISDAKFFYDERDNLIDEIDIFKEEYKIMNSDLSWSEANTVGYRNRYFYNEHNLLTKHEMYLGENIIMAYEYSFEYWNEG